MPRFTEKSDRNEFIVNDKISGDVITLYYRTPTAEDHIRYSKAKIIRQGNKIKDQVTETLLKYGEEILTDFKKGGFAKTVGNKHICYASDPEDADYDPNWRQMLHEHAADLLILLGMHVFEAREMVGLQFADEEENIEKN